jgi:hypothetical protein
MDTGSGIIERDISAKWLIVHNRQSRIVLLVSGHVTYSNAHPTLIPVLVTGMR